MPRSIPRPKPLCAYPDCGKFISYASTHCRKHSAMLRANTPDGRARMSKAAKAQNGQAWKGRKHSEASKAIIREKRAKQVISEESIKKHADALRGRPNLKGRGRFVSEQERAQRSATLLAQHDYLSRIAKERYANETEDERERRLTNWIQAGQANIPKMLNGTTIETYLAQCLDLAGIEYEQQKKISYYIVDFCIPSRKVIVEANGCFWHGCEICGFNEPRHIEKRAKEQIRTARLQKKGYTVITIWEHEIRKAMQDGAHCLHLGL